jgi:hypothetical protein
MTLIFLGVSVLLYALIFMSVSLGRSVVNLDLLHTRQNLVIVGALLILLGAIWAVTIRLTSGTLQEKSDAPSVKKWTLPRLSSLSEAARLRLLRGWSLPIGIIGAWIFLASMFDANGGSVLELILGYALYLIPWIIYRNILAATRGGKPLLVAFKVFSWSLLVLILVTMTVDELF